MFPGANARIYTNEAGEPIGWDYPPDEDAYYCDMCGINHVGDCPIDDEEE
jgi:hypothetical protein